MRKHIPDFDFFDLDQQVKYLSRKLISAFLQNDIETFQLLTAETALAVMIPIMKARIDQGMECKIKEPIYVDEPTYKDSFIIDDSTVKFQFIVSTQEVNCLVNNKGEIVQGRPTLVESIMYLIDIQYDPEAKVDEVGHSWVVTRIDRVGVVEQLI